jgi:hypothetical protein
MPLAAQRRRLHPVAATSATRKPFASCPRRRPPRSTGKETWQRDARTAAHIGGVRFPPRTYQIHAGTDKFVIGYEMEFESS